MLGELYRMMERDVGKTLWNDGGTTITNRDYAYWNDGSIETNQCTIVSWEHF